MRAVATKMPAIQNTSSPFIFNLAQESLSNVPFHQSTNTITRYFADSFPLHLAIHEVSPVLRPPGIYTQPHVHEDADEMNIIISAGKLSYNIQLGEEQYAVTNNACIWIPKGMAHAANVVEGSGFYIALRLPDGFTGLMMKMKELYANFQR